MQPPAAHVPCPLHVVPPVVAHMSGGAQQLEPGRPEEHAAAARLVNPAVVHDPGSLHRPAGCVAAAPSGLQLMGGGVEHAAPVYPPEHVHTPVV